MGPADLKKLLVPRVFEGLSVDDPDEFDSGAVADRIYELLEEGGTVLKP